MSADVGDMVCLLHSTDLESRLGVATIYAVRETDEETLIDCVIHWDSVDTTEPPLVMERQPQDVIFCTLPDSTWDERYKDVLDYLAGYLTHEDVANLLDGEPSYVTNGERGYEAARFAVLDGIDTSIQENSRLHGHEPGRYARYVQRQVEDLPDWITESVLQSEKDLWENDMGFDEENAEYLVELMLLEQEQLGESDDTDAEIHELVNEFDLEYDNYRDDHGVEC